MNTKLLKQKILDLAIRGKLSQQLKSDGTAADLLKEICDRTQEKTSLRAKRGNPSPQTIIPLDKNEVPFEIPANWEWVRLGDVGALKGGKRVPAGKTMTTEPTSHIYIRITDMREGTIYDDDLHYVTDEIYEVIKNYTISKNDLYITIAGTIGRVGLVPDLFDGMNLTENALKITNVIPDKKYLMYALQSGFVQDYFESTYHQVAMPKLSLTNASKALLPLPPLAEQQRIVAKIEEAFAEIDAIEKNKELLKTHIKQTRQKILDLAIHGKLVPQNKSDEPASVLLERITRDNPHYEKIEDEPFEIPENWAWCRLGNICDKLIDGDHNPPKGLDYTTEYMMLSSRNINDNGIVDLENVRYLSKDTFEEENLRTKLEKGDILFTSVGSLGRSCVFSGDGKYCFQRSVSVIHTNIYNKYLKYFFDSNYYQKYIV
ncbi:restriction endonuclease subunit S, partial [uncultured Fibrobacter sp.]|uniref:restriction endonuclease subunit S n=1 Tax=uncultured Fibrobacter sp. TaxID=261512 RepID=UPI0025EFFB52